MKIDRATLSAFACIASACLSATTLFACGGSSGTKAVSVASLAKCSHASPGAVSAIPADASSQRQVVAMTLKEGWLQQHPELSASSQAELEAQETKPQFDFYIFKDAKTAEGAFKLISQAPNAAQEYGAGGTFRRGNVIANAEQGSPSTLTPIAESLLNQCVGAGASQSVFRSESTPESTGEESSTNQTEAPGESEPSQGQSPAP